MAQKKKIVSGRNLVTPVSLPIVIMFDTPQRQSPRTLQQGLSSREHIERYKSHHRNCIMLVLPGERRIKLNCTGKTSEN